MARGYRKRASIDSILRCLSSSKDFVCVQQPDGSLTTLTKEEVQSQILGSVFSPWRGWIWMNYIIRPTTM